MNTTFNLKILEIHNFSYLIPHYYFKINLPQQGYKIHLSSDFEHDKTLLKKIIPFLIKNKLVFKIVANQNLLKRLNQGEFSFTQIGKFITIYPTSQNQTLKLLPKLYQLTQNFKGPTIHSDLLYQGIVYYRYGSFESKNIIQQNQTVLDDRRFLGNGNFILNQSCSLNKIIDHNHNRYFIYQIIKNDYKGAVFEAFQFNKNQFNQTFLKMGRNRIFDPNNIHSLESITNEYNILNQLKNIPSFPQVNTLFFLNQDICLVTQKIKAQNLVLCAPLSLKTILEIFLKVKKLIKILHKKNIYHQDIAPQNILWNGTDTFIIDFETALLDPQKATYRDRAGQ